MKGYSPPPLHPLHPLPLPSVCRGITAQRRQGRSMPCFCQFKQRDRALYSNLYYAFSVQCKQSLSRHVNMCSTLFVFNFCLTTALWQLLSHPEKHLIHSCGFNVILHKVARLLAVTLKMFGPGSIDHSQEKNILIPHV